MRWRVIGRSKSRVMATKMASLTETMAARARGNKGQGECSKNDNIHFAVEG